MKKYPVSNEDAYSIANDWAIAHEDRKPGWIGRAVKSCKEVYNNELWNSMSVARLRRELKYIGGLVT